LDLIGTHASNTARLSTDVEVASVDAKTDVDSEPPSDSAAPNDTVAVRVLQNHSDRLGAVVVFEPEAAQSRRVA
jgi:hypothetical protein